MRKVAPSADVIVSLSQSVGVCLFSLPSSLDNQPILEKGFFAHYIIPLNGLISFRPSQGKVGI